MKLRFLYFLLFSNTILLANERGVVPTINLLQGQWGGIDLTNYFMIDDNSIHIYDNLKYKSNVSGDSLLVLPNSDVKGYHPITIDIGDSSFSVMSRIEELAYYYFKISYDQVFQQTYDSVENQVYVMGNFNNWNRTSHPLNFDGNNWTVKLPFSPGTYEYKFIVNGKEIVDPNNAKSKANGFGGYNSIFEIKSSIINDVCLIKDSWDNQNQHLIFSICNRYKKNEELNFQVFFNNKILDSSKYSLVRNTDELLFKISLSTLKDGLLRIYLNEKKSGLMYLENNTIIKNNKPLIPKDSGNSAYFKIIYSLMIDRFNNGNKKNDMPVNDEDIHELANYHGGDIVGITQKIKEGYFSSLGINTIWLSPIFQGPDSAFIESIYPNRKYTGYHGYWPVESRKVDSRYGNDEDLKNMINTAHESGISVLLDFVSNHTHKEHHYYIEHPEWFGEIELENGELNIRNWSDETMLTTWFDSFLPSLDYENNDDAINQVIEDAIYWVREFGFDGFRQDATKHVPHKFWKNLRYKLDENFPNKKIFQIGETFGSDDLILSYVNPGELDSQFNFSNYFGLREFIVSGSTNPNKIINKINQNLIKYGPINLMGNITSSHDQVRFMALVDGQIRMDENGVERSFSDLPVRVNELTSYNRHFMFTALNMMLPGIPVIYYGEEYGQIGSNDPGNRTDMRFSNSWSDLENMLFQKVKMLSQARQKKPSMALGDFSFIFDDNGKFICKKQYFDDVTLFIFNLSDEQKNINLIPNSDGIWHSLLDRSMLQVIEGKTQLFMEPYETKVYNLYN